MAKTALKTKPEPSYELLSTLAISMRYHLTRETVLRRITDAGIKPVLDEPKKKLYEMTPELIAAVNKRSDTIDAVKLRREEAQAQLVEAKVAVIHGELVQLGEVTDTIQRLFGSLYKEIAVKQPQRLGSKLSRAKTAAAAAKILKGDTDRIFRTLRDDFEKFLK